MGLAGNHVSIDVRHVDECSKMLEYTRGLDLAIARQVFGDDVHARLMGRLMVLEGLKVLSSRQNFPMVSGLTQLERLFTAGFFSKLWSGSGNVLEIGPHLGSSTWAVCVGMVTNPDFSGQGRMFTYDRFTDYDLTDSQLAQMSLSDDELRDYRASGNFQPLFESYHGQQDYAPFLKSALGVLPGVPGEESTLEDCFCLPDDTMYNAVFIDGCKSWYGTKYFMKEACEKLEVGAHLIFQDYGHYTCFWLPALVITFSEYFELIAHVDNTYTFRLTKPLCAGEVEALFPDQPEQFPIQDIARLFAIGIQDASMRSDIFGLLAINMQYAAALAYVGRKDMARRWLQGLKGQLGFRPYREMLDCALESPTYRPDGDIRLND